MLRIYKIKVFLFLLSFFISGICPAYAFHVDFSIEEDDLGTLPDAIVSIIRHGNPSLAECEVVGKPINLSGVENPKDYFYVVTATGHGCQGNASGPLWILRKSADGHMELILDTTGAIISINKQAHKGMMDVTVYGGSAGDSHDGDVWAFDGAKYSKVPNLPH